MCKKCNIYLTYPKDYVKHDAIVARCGLIWFWLKGYYCVPKLWGYNLEIHTK